MFERYTERARRVLFFARYEASQLGSVSIETEHLLLGLIREGKGLTSRIFARSQVPSTRSGRKSRGGRSSARRCRPRSRSRSAPRPSACCSTPRRRPTGSCTTTSGPSTCCSASCARSAPLAASILMEKGMRLDHVREDIVQLLNEKTTAAPRPKETPLLAEFSRDLTEAAGAEPARPAGRPRARRWSASSRCSAGGRRTTPCSSASRASARPRSSRGWRSGSSTATCRTSWPTSASSRSTSRSSWRARSTAASSRSGSRRS